MYKFSRLHVHGPSVAVKSFDEYSASVLPYLVVLHAYDYMIACLDLDLVQNFFVVFAVMVEVLG